MSRHRRDHTTSFKGQSGDCRPQGRRDAGRVRGDGRRSSESNTPWKTQPPENAAGVFATAAKKQAASPDLKDWHATSGQQALAIDFLAGALGHIGDARVTR